MIRYKVGTRESKLAIIQAELVCKALIEANPSLNINQFELVKIKTTGDKFQNKNLVDIGGKNLFIKEIEEALISKEIDFAVHSLKDMTANLDPNLTIAACLKREDPRDAFISNKYQSLNQMAENSVLGTSSIRRKYMALHSRPDLMVIPFRGNVLSRLEKLKQNQVDATFLAVAGLKRLGIDPTLYYPLEISDFLPAISQGVVGVECSSNDEAIYSLLRSINDQDTEICTRAERAFLEYMEADCSVPIAAYASLICQQIHMEALVIDALGGIHKISVNGDAKDAEKLGIKAGVMLKGYL